MLHCFHVKDHHVHTTLQKTFWKNQKDKQLKNPKRTTNTFGSPSKIGLKSTSKTLILTKLAIVVVPTTAVVRCDFANITNSEAEISINFSGKGNVSIITVQDMGNASEEFWRQCTKSSRDKIK